MAKHESPTDPDSNKTYFVVRLREALIAAEADAANDPHSPRRDSLQRQVDIAAEPLMRRCFDGLLGYCDSLARNSIALKDHADGADIAQDAWVKAIRYLKSDHGARLQNDEHFFRFLHVCAKRRFLDIREIWAVSLEETPSPLDKRTRESSTEFFAALASDRAMEMIALLFTDEEGFRNACRKPVRRRLRHFQGFTLYHLGQFLDSDGMIRDTDGRGSPSRTMVGRMRHYARILGVEPAVWHAVEVVVERCAIIGLSPSDFDAELLDEVNRLCGSSLKLGNNLSVLRSEMNGFISG